ncbi:MAG: hypothetical protein RJB26_1321 [Pseudomonadota bacterium]
MTDTTDTAALVERLQRRVEFDNGPADLLCQQAADTIARQAARIKALEEGLRDVINVPQIAGDVAADSMRIIAERALKRGRDDR